LGKFLILLILTFSMASWNGVFASESEAIEISQLQEALPISARIQALLDDENRSLEELMPLFEREGQAAADLISGGYREGFYWVKLALINSSDAPASTQLLIKNRLTSHLEIFVPAPDENAAVTIRRLPTTLPTLAITLAAHKQAHIYLKLQFGLQNYVQFLLAPEDEASLLSSTTRLQEFFFGIIVGLLFFNLALYLITGEPSFALHAISAVFVFMVVFMAGGQVYFYFGVDSPNRYLPIAGCLAVAFMNGFGLAYLRHQNPPRYLTLLLNLGMMTGFAGAFLLAVGVDRRLIYLTDLNLLLLISDAVLVVFLYPPTRYRNMRFYVVGWLSLGVSGVAWLGSEYGFLPKNIYTEGSFNFGMAIEMIIISLGLADRINDYKNTLKRYNKNLEILVDEKTRDIRSMMDHIPIGICMITANNRIHKDYSRRFREFFPVGDLDQRAATEVIFEKALISADAKSQASSAVVAALGEDIVNFEVNAESLPAEIKWLGKDQTTHIMDLTWNALQNPEGQVDRILVTMRDVTDLRGFQERSRLQQMELDIIKEILDVPTDRFEKFLRTAREKLRTDDPRQLFLNLHTIKGTARAFYFKEMTAVLHELEQSLMERQQQGGALDPLFLKAALEKAEGILRRYEDIAREKLNRSLDQEQLDAKSTLLLSDALKEYCSRLPSLAKELNKLPPNVHIEGPPAYLTDAGEKLLRDVFVHILGNIMDHGLETAEDRKSLGKNPVGSVRIRFVSQAEAGVLTIGDDGRGLNMDKIREQGMKLGLIEEQASVEAQALADLIFHPSLSTAGRTTTLSGRGVGMSAVRESLRAAGGEIQLVLMPEQEGSSFRNFSFVITLPTRIFEPALHVA
jgi:HPt (histidine-containing phosphotransfer) domain-containing protein/PAS domain-containing protein